jgi:hypothetical protein
MAESKTKPTQRSVTEFIAALPHPVRRADAEHLLAMMAATTGEKGTMWGPTMIGYGTRHYRYDSGREGDVFRIGFAPRGGHQVLYILNGFADQDALLSRLGKFKTSGDSGGCLYINKLADIDLDVLQQMFTAAWANEAVDGPC